MGYLELFSFETGGDLGVRLAHGLENVCQTRLKTARGGGGGVQKIFNFELSIIARS